MIYTDPKIEFIRFGGECDIITGSCTVDCGVDCDTETIET